MKKVDLSRKQELIVDGNPLTYPPPDVCDCGLKSMMRYFQETQANVKVYQGVKVSIISPFDAYQIVQISLVVKLKCRVRLMALMFLSITYHSTRASQ